VWAKVFPYKALEWLTYENGGLWCIDTLSAFEMASRQWGSASLGPAGKLVSGPTNLNMYGGQSTLALRKALSWCQEAQEQETMRAKN
jgi:hypothetical protein